MEIRFQTSPAEVATMNTEKLRSTFLAGNLMEKGMIHCLYSHYDRVITGGAMPAETPIRLTNDPELKADYFLERRELGIINVGGAGTVSVDDVRYEVNKMDALYVGKGTKEVIFTSADIAAPACFFLMSSPAHVAHPARMMKKEEASPAQLGETATANKRTIYKYIHAGGIASCQLVMGLTVLEPGSVWNTMPAHTHTRRMEAYFYFDIPQAHRVFHLMGEPSETRHILVANHQAVVSPPWSIHSGCGTTNYSFIWGMAGENYTFTDMDAVAIDDLK